MNDKNELPEQKLAPLDAFEQQWVAQLAKREPDLVQTEDAFVRRVLQAEAAASAGSSAVIGRIGFTLLPYAAAAAILLAAYIGWVVFKDNATNTPNEPNFVVTPTIPTQPDDEPKVVTNVRPKVELGKLIAQATTTNSASNVTATVGEVPQTLSVNRLIELMGDSVPDLKEILAPLDQKKQQSRV